MRAPSTRLRLRVAPGARRSEIVGRHGDGWRIRVQAAPERGRANDEVLALLATGLGIPSGDITLVAGSSSRDKLVSVAGVAPDETDRRLERLTRAPR